MPRHVIVDGSNLATEGRTMPSLKQLIDAVQSFIEEHPNDLITVVVDATFGHRIDPKEVAEFEAAIEHNEMVAPPAGAVGRGDAFVLAIAKKVNATILSNDSFQEFHGEQLWLFDEGRLIGGKPVPHIGWVFVPRVPVRGPLSRKVQREARGRGTSRDKAVVASGSRSRGPATVEPIAVIGSKEASQPMPVPKAPPPNVRRGSPAAASATEAAPRSDSRSKPDTKATAQTSVPARGAMVNDLLPFLSFVETHPVGSTVDVAVESYSSHGAYGHVGDARVYLPLRNIADPAPRSARDAVQLGEVVPMVVVALQPAKRGIDVAMPSMAASLVPAAAPAAAKPTKRPSKKAAAAAMAAEPLAAAPLDTPRPVKRGRKAAAASPAVSSSRDALTPGAASSIKAKVEKAATPRRSTGKAAEPSSPEPTTTEVAQPSAAAGVQETEPTVSAPAQVDAGKAATKKSATSTAAPAKAAAQKTPATKPTKPAAQKSANAGTKPSKAAAPKSVPAQTKQPSKAVSSKSASTPKGKPSVGDAGQLAEAAASGPAKRAKATKKG